jgi:myosin heavy subunit
VSHRDCDESLLNLRLEECLIENDPSKYFYVAQGMLTIDGIDDTEEMKLTDEAFDVLGFTQVRIDQDFLSRGTRASI